MKLYKKLFSRWTGVAMLATMGLFACQPEIDEPTLTTGSADFTTYVALGNSLTSGYADGALYREGQINSYPEMMAASIRQLNPNLTFSTPLVPEGISAGSGADARRSLVGFTPEGLPILEAEPTNPTVFASVAAGGPYQNLGVPGAKSFHLVAPGYGNPANLPSAANPFFVRFASNPETSVVADAAAQNPTFFTLWIGNNDVLGYALAGGDQGNDPITPTPLFEQAINGIVTGLDGASGGAIANIPDILEIPFFTTVAHDDFELDETQATTLNTLVRAEVSANARPTIQAQVEANRPAIEVGVTAKVKEGAKQEALAGGATEEQAEAIANAFIASPTGQATIAAGVEGEIERLVEENLNALLTSLPTVSTGNNPFIIQGQPSQTNPTGLRVATENDLILLSASSYISEGAEQNPPRSPILPESFVLDPSEQAKIDAAVAEFNTVLQAAAGAKYAYVDMNGFFNQVKNGYLYQGVNYDARFILGGAFSLDGVHLTQRGYALAGNEFIKAINAKYNSKLPWIEVNSYKGITFP